jgi:hypothetical protein
VAQRSDEIRSELARTREEMGSTVDALGYKADVPARTKGWLGGKRDSVVGAAGSAVSKVSGTTDAMVSRVSGVAPSTGDIQAGAGRVKDTAERNPLGLAIAGAAVGVLAGLAAPSTSIENERIGPVADQVKETAKETGQEALDRGREVAEAAAHSAVETAKDEGRAHGHELASGMRDEPDGLA